MLGRTRHSNSRPAGTDACRTNPSQVSSCAHSMRSSARERHWRARSGCIDVGTEQGSRRQEDAPPIGSERSASPLMESSPAALPCSDAAADAAAQQTTSSATPMAVRRPKSLRARGALSRAAPVFSPINIRPEVLQDMQVPTPIGALLVSHLADTHHFRLQCTISCCISPLCNES